MYLGYWFDPTMILLLPAVLLAAYAQFKVQSTFNKYSQISNSKGKTGAEVATYLLRANGIHDVKVEPTRGNLTDHYDPRSKVIRLSESVYSSDSLAAIGVAAHETGHAIQDNVDYMFLRVRHAIFPVVNIASSLSMPLFFIGILFSISGLMQLGILFFVSTLVFQVVTLPVEFNASSRAMDILEENNFVNREEIGPAKKVLNAAALTYVAAAIMSLMQLIRLLVLANMRSDD